MPPAARLSDMHTCPVVNPGPVPHVGGPIAVGCPTVLIGFMPAARVGDTAIVGISPDTPAKLKKFDEKYGLGFTLLSDAEHATAEAYGVWVEKSMYGKRYFGVQRSAFLIDESGTVTHAWPKISPKDTPTNLLAALAA